MAKTTIAISSIVIPKIRFYTKPAGADPIDHASDLRFHIYRSYNIIAYLYNICEFKGIPSDRIERVTYRRKEMAWRNASYKYKVANHSMSLMCDV